MFWIIGLVSFLVGAATGALLFRVFKSDEVKVKDLEEQLQKLSEEHESYKGGVHAHFNDTAKLMREMTESYRKVYLQISNSAQTLCPDYISSQLSLSNEAKVLLNKDLGSSAKLSEQGDQSTPEPPLDYAARNDADNKGALSEDYGFAKPE